MSRKNEVRDVDEGLEMIVVRKDVHAVRGEEVSEERLELGLGGRGRLLAAIQVCPN